MREFQVGQIVYYTGFRSWIGNFELRGPWIITKEILNDKGRLLFELKHKEKPTWKVQEYACLLTRVPEKCPRKRFTPCKN